MGEGVQKKVNSIFDTVGNEIMLKIKNQKGTMLSILLRDIMKNSIRTGWRNSVW